MHGTLVDILVLLAASLALDMPAERLRRSAILGSLVAGTLVGPDVLGWVAPGERIDLRAELGASHAHGAMDAGSGAAAGVVVLLVGFRPSGRAVLESLPGAMRAEAVAIGANAQLRAESGDAKRRDVLLHAGIGGARVVDEEVLVGRRLADEAAAAGIARDPLGI